jgi:hypothetical protein
MNRAVSSRSVGYTIVETMIFLAVSAAMFMSAMALISGRQNRTEFNSSIRDFEASMNDLANDVTNGYYSNTTSNGQTFYCHASATTLLVNTTSSTTQGCTFIGKALQFSPANTDKAMYSVINLVGRQFKNADPSYGDVQNIDDASVVAVSPAESAPYNAVPDATQDIRINGGVTAECVVYSLTLDPPNQPCSSGLTKIDTITFMTTFHGIGFNGDQESGSSDVNLLVPTAAALTKPVGQTKANAAERLNAYKVANTATPSRGVHICLQSNGTNEYALVTIGGKSSQFVANTQVFPGQCS